MKKSRYKTAKKNWLCGKYRCFLIKMQAKDMTWSWNSRSLMDSDNGKRSRNFWISTFIWSRRCLEAPRVDLNFKAVGNIFKKIIFFSLFYLKRIYLKFGFNKTGNKSSIQTLNKKLHRISVSVEGWLSQAKNDQFC